MRPRSITDQRKLSSSIHQERIKLSRGRISNTPSRTKPKQFSEVLAVSSLIGKSQAPINRSGFAEKTPISYKTSLDVMRRSQSKPKGVNEGIALGLVKEKLSHLYKRKFNICLKENQRLVKVR